MVVAPLSATLQAENTSRESVSPRKATAGGGPISSVPEELKLFPGEILDHGYVCLYNVLCVAC